MGRVYRARHTRVSRCFAIKVLHSEHCLRDKMVHRFQREAEAASRLRHRNVVPVVDFGETDDRRFYLVMDYVEGVTMRQLICDHGPIAAERTLDLLAQLCDGLAHAHGRGLIHRDLKPENILIEPSEDGELVHIADFGNARDTAARADDGERLTTQGIVLGTPYYMAPEQATDQELDHRVDLYALGAVLYELLAGVMPFQGSPPAVARMHVVEPPPLIRDRVPGLAVDPLLEALARWLLAKDREQRPQSARQVAGLVRLLRTDRTAAMRAIGAAAGSAVPPIDDVVTTRRPTAKAAAAPTQRIRRSSRAPAVFGSAIAIGLLMAGAAPPPRPAAPAPAVATAAPDVPALTGHHRAIGRRLQEVVAKRGPATAAPLRARYRAIPLAAALRDPEIAADVERDLAELGRDLDRALE